MIYKAKDLPADKRTVLESLLGRRVSENEAISVRAFEAPAISDERRRQVASQLRNFLAELDANRRPASSEEASAILNEAISSVRPRFRSK